MEDKPLDIEALKSRSEFTILHSPTKPGEKPYAYGHTSMVDSKVSSKTRKSRNTESKFPTSEINES